MEGFGKVISNRQTVEFGIIYPTTPPGATILKLPGLGVFFVSLCQGPEFGPQLGMIFRNTSDEAIDVLFGSQFGPPLPPGQEVFVFGEGPSTIQLGAGSGGNRKVATVTSSNYLDLVQNNRRFNVQGRIGFKGTPAKAE